MATPIVSESGSMMNRLTLSEKWAKFLASQPETGMGFQEVEITTTAGTKIRGVALNGQFLDTLPSICESEITDMRVKTGQEIGRWG